MAKTPWVFIFLACAGLALATEPAGAALFPMDPELLRSHSYDVERPIDPPPARQASTPKPVVPVPEPNSLILLGAGLLALGVVRRGIRKR